MTNRITENPVSETVGIMPWQSFALDEPRVFHSSEEMVHALGLDWQVEVKPLINARTGEQARKFREVYRADTGQTLGIVKGQYRPIQNVDAFGFLPEVAGEHGLKVVAGGSVEDGAKTWILAELRERELPNRILPNGERDRLVNHLLFWNSHDGSSSRKVGALTYAFWCANALAAAWRNAEHTFATQHSKSAPWRLAEVNKQIVEAIHGMDAFNEDLAQLEAQAIKRAEVKTIAEQVIADVYGAIADASETEGDEDAEKKRQRLADLRADKAERIATLFDGEGRSCRGETRLDALQAITEFIDHHRKRKATANALQETLTGYNSQRLRTAAMRRLTA